MSIILGIANLDNTPIKELELHRFAEHTKTYALDGTFVHAAGSIAMGYQPYHTTVRSQFEVQPWSDDRENILVFDGRLDNHSELAQLLSMENSGNADSLLVLAAFERWGEDCLERLIGDWSLAIWSAAQRALYLARDHAGMRTLFYQLRGRRLVWSTYLETFLQSGEELSLDEEFAARYLGGLPIRTTTPYLGVRAVPPAQFMRFNEWGVRSGCHWNHMVREKLVYKDAGEYDDHFLELLQRSVRRRDTPGSSILAELSGGMDSTGIVCVSDLVRRRNNQEAPLIDTVSLYDSSEPDWNELPYINATEKYRGKTGVHIPTSYLERSFEFLEQSPCFPYPGHDSNARQREEVYEAHIAQDEYRVVLSGIGGDELLGGVPTPYPDLADQLASLHIRTFLKRTVQWCLSSRDAFLPTILRTFRYTFNLYQHPLFESTMVAPWTSHRTYELCADLARDEEKEYARVGYPPSSIGNSRSWLSILETLPHLWPKSTVRREYRYPYLDRDLVEFLFRVPREQLVQPGRRRAMMRRALKSVMPLEVVERRRKGFIGRGPHALIQREQPNINKLLISPLIESLGFVDVSKLKMILQTICSGNETAWTMAFLRTMAFELWLRADPGHLDRSRYLVAEAFNPLDGANKILTTHAAS